MICAKFGGRSVENTSAIAASIDIIRHNNAIKVVVVSAPFGMTDHLVQMSRTDLTKIQRQFHQQAVKNTVDGLLSDLNDPDQLKEQLYHIIDRMHLAEANVKDMPSAKTRDALISLGEYITTAVFNYMLDQQGIKGHVIDAQQLITTDGNHGQAQPKLIAIAKNSISIWKQLTTCDVVITQGFVGSTESGDITTLGRGGSDYSAALLAEAMYAQCLQIWTDVEGLYAIDPKLHHNPRKIDEISYHEACQLASFGAKVLHPCCLRPALRSQFKVFVGSSLNAKKPGTYISHHVAYKPTIRAITHKENQTLFVLKSHQRIYDKAYLANVFGIIAKHQFTVDIISTSEMNLAFTLDQRHYGALENHQAYQGLIDDLEQLHQTELSIHPQLDLIALVGNRLNNTPGVISDIFAHLESYHISLISHGASENHLCFLVEHQQSKDLMQTLYHAIFEKPRLQDDILNHLDLWKTQPDEN